MSVFVSVCVCVCACACVRLKFSPQVIPEKTGSSYERLSKETF